MSLTGLIWLHLKVFAAVAVVLSVVVVVRNAVVRFLIPAVRCRLARRKRRSVASGAPRWHRLDDLPGRTHPLSDFLRLASPSSWQATNVLLITLCASVSAVADENWASFQNGGRVSFAEAGAPGDLQLAWTADVAGYGQSSPVIWEGRVYVTSVSGANKETYHVSAYRLADGEKLWQHDFPNASPRESSNYVSKAAPTPAADENGVVCFFEGGNLLGLSHDGEVRWERNLVSEYGAIDSNHGLAASVEQSDDTVFIWAERKTDPYVLAVEKSSGETRWKAAGLGVTSWASPRLVPVEGGSHLVLSGIGRISGLDPESGKRLWTFEKISGNSTPTPMPLGEGRFLIGATVGRGEADSGRAAESNGVIAIKKQPDGTWRADFVWKARQATSAFGSPIDHAGHVYFVNRSGVLFCLDVESGEEKYVQRLGNSLWATPVARGDRLYFFGKEGTLVTASKGPSFRMLAETELLSARQRTGHDDPTSASEATLYGVAVVGNRFLIRFGRTLHCLQPPVDAR